MWGFNLGPPDYNSSTLTSWPPCNLNVVQADNQLTLSKELKSNLAGIKTPTGRSRTSLLFKSVTEDLNSGLPWTNPARGQSAATDCKSSSLTTLHAVYLIHYCLSSHRAWLRRRSGFYLGFLRSRSSPHPPQKILLSLQYTSNYIGKIIRCDEVSAREEYSPSDDTIVSQYAPDCLSY